MKVCSKILFIKDLFKYCYNGHDCTRIKLTNLIKIDMNIDNDDSNHEKIINSDKIQQHLDTRYVCPPEAWHRIFEFLMDKISHAVHEKDGQNVYFKKGCEEKRVGKKF